MRPNALKIRELIKQYPFVADILSARMEPYDGDGGTKVDDLTIKVEKADRDLMFRQAKNVGLDDNSFFFHLKGSRKGQVMRCGEYAFAVNKTGKVINRLDFPRNDNERRKNLGETYAWAVLWASKVLSAGGKGYLYTDTLEEETKYIVWVTVKAWHTDTKNDDAPGSRFGKFRNRFVCITIYGEPDEGFALLQGEANIYENLFLDDRVIMRGVVNKDHDIVSISGMLNELCILFQDEVYFNGMKAIMDGGVSRGASGQFGSVKVLAAEMCGYNRVMLDDAASCVTFQLRPDSKHMYVLGQQGTLPQIRNLVKTVVRMWNQKPELRETFKPDKDVSVM